MTVDGTLGPPGGGTRATGPGGGAATSGVDSALVGRWFRLILLYDALGPVASNETTWQFFVDGTATKTLVTRDYIEGWYDVGVLTVRWKADGQQVAITYPPPDGGTFQYPYRFVHDSLIFAGQGYVRLR